MSLVPHSAGRPLRHAALALAALACLTLAACHDDRVLARVGNRTITVDAFTDYAQVVMQRYPALPDSAKRMLLDDMIRRELMLDEAEARGMTKDTMLATTRETAANGLLAEALGQQIAPPGTGVSDAEVDTYYDGLKTEYHLQVIATLDSSLAGEALRRLRRGEPFAQVASRFNVSQMAPPDGDLGWKPGGALVGPIDDWSRTAKIGSQIGPIYAGGDTWLIARLLGRRPANPPPPPLAQVRDRVRQIVAQRKQQAIVQRLVDNLRTEYHVTVAPGGAQAMFAQANLDNMDSTASQHMPDEGLVLAHYDSLHRGRTAYTMGDALNDLRAGAQPPDYTSVPSIQNWILSRVVQRLVSLEARRRLLDQDPTLARHIQDRVDAVVLQSLYDTEVMANASVTDAEMQAEYEQRLAGHTAPPLDSLPPELREQLHQLTIQDKRQQLLRAFTEGLYRKYPVTVNDALLRKVRLPAPTMPPMAG